mgnify:CR=1 FL=1
MELNVLELFLKKMEQILLMMLKKEGLNMIALLKNIDNYGWNMKHLMKKMLLKDKCNLFLKKIPKMKHHFKVVLKQLKLVLNNYQLHQFKEHSN